MQKFIISKQSNITILNGVVNSEILNKVSKVLKYGDNEWGYQREQKPEHIKAILKYIESKKNDCLFPNSVILAMSENDYNKSNNEGEVIELDLTTLSLRIVDGQHRLEAIKQSKYEFNLNVVILVIPEDQRTKELDIFITINSKAKRIPTDLAELAQYRYLLLNKKNNFDLNESVDYVSMKIIVELNQDNLYWKDAIKINVNEKLNTGIVGVSAFKKTITDIVKIELKNLEELDLKKLDSKSTEIKEFINNIWEICISKWKYCFNINENHKPIYLSNCYIQKTMGISVIHGLIKDIYLDEEKKLEKNSKLIVEKDVVLNNFRSIIEKSKVKSLNWESGNVMSGYSSESGFSKIRSFIKNDITL